MTKPPIQNDAIQIYEVIRIIDGIPLFVGDHLERLAGSVSMTGVWEIPTPSTIQQLISNLLQSEKRDSGNIKLSFTKSSVAAEPHFELEFIPHYYPTRQEYLRGVKVGLLEANRPVPNAKIRHSEIRKLADQSIAANEFYEVLLVDADGNITEGSRSNVFFIKDETLYSSPGDNILRGITRHKILDICNSEGIKVIETEIPANFLDQFDSAFLTGTSPKILPVNQIGQVNFKTDNILIIRLQNSFDQLIENYIAEYKSRIPT